MIRYLERAALILHLCQKAASPSVHESLSCGQAERLELLLTGIAVDQAVAELDPLAAPLKSGQRKPLGHDVISQWSVNQV
jgi:hypothetical protein